MSGRKVIEAGDERAQNPVVDIECKEDEQDDRLIEDGEYGGIGLGLRIEHAHIAALARQTGLNVTVLRFADLHLLTISENYSLV